MKHRPILFVVPAIAMLIVGFGLMFAAITGGRLSSEDAFLLPLGFTTAATGGMLLSRTKIAVFFLFLYAIAALVLSIIEVGFLSPLPVVFGLLLIYCLPLIKNAKH